MRSIILLVWLVIGLAFGGVESPAAAHGATAIDGAIMMTDHAFHLDEDQNGASTSDHGERCHSLVHHHCSIGLAADGATLPGLSAGRDAKPWAFGNAVLIPFSEAPPLEPPST
jgi:hypothetical protein